MDKRELRWEGDWEFSVGGGGRVGEQLQVLLGILYRVYFTDASPGDIVLLGVLYRCSQRGDTSYINHALSDTLIIVQSRMTKSNTND